MREFIFEFVISHGNANEIENAKFSKKIENPFAYHHPNWFRCFVASEKKHVYLCCNLHHHHLYLMDGKCTRLSNERSGDHQNMLSRKICRIHFDCVCVIQNIRIWFTYIICRGMECHGS